MDERQRTFKIVLIGLCIAHFLAFYASRYAETAGITGLLYPNGTPVGGDFINLWAAGRLVLSGAFSDIYDVDRFMAYERGFTGAAIGVRLWAYPPHSLLFAWPLGLFGFYAALALWSVAGLAVLHVGARRFGFDRLETAAILMSPATVLNLYSGQSGSLATGLLLVALSPRKGGGALSAGAAALLTIKPQAGFLLPLLWAFQRRWLLIICTALAAIALTAIATAFFGLDVWRGYLSDTLPALSHLEREGSGPFTTMIPSLFMALRIVTDDADLASAGHLAFALSVALVLVLRLRQTDDPVRQSSLLLIATVLMTPYIHNYDLAILACGTLLVARRADVTAASPLLVRTLVVTAWLLPQLVVTFNVLGLPVSPLLVLPLLFLA
ncbi:hypothetical protein MesoLjLc_41660 [Mesorhizobium sp. L-8-10]|uniref:glycosyltransferase family 87 protein n=1 Tax=Mesorhizobium sp. L-8-10 TaxID=2744523 RepID=UPI00192657EC|nr:glycosyltransferase family 87 protein [Mesorhizobium sp. L-8-10]BCH32236.1 hypothetical protein MesoLjLc_41660 [Mesorhizobium sp. L-8-10]